MIVKSLMRHFGLHLMTGALMAPVLSAAVINGEFTFEGKVPLSGVAWVESIPGAPVSLTIGQKNKIFAPGLVFAPMGSTLVLENDDDQEHNAFTKDASLDIDLGLAAPGKKITQPITWPDGTFVRFGCKIHPAMQLWVGSIASPLVAQPSFDRQARSGKVQISNVPAGAAKVHVWLPLHEPIMTEVGANPVVVDLVFKGRKSGSVTLSLGQ